MELQEIIMHRMIPRIFVIISEMTLIAFYSLTHKILKNNYDIAAVIIIWKRMVKVPRRYLQVFQGYTV